MRSDDIDCDSVDASGNQNTVYVSNGSEFYEISIEDLPEAEAEGFYLPEQRGLCLVANGDELFEIPIEDLLEAEADGFCRIGVNELNDSVSESSDQTHVGSEVETSGEQQLSARQDDQSRNDGLPVVFEDSMTEEEIYREALRQRYAESSGFEQWKVAILLKLPSRQAIRSRVSTFAISAILHAVVLIALTLIVFSSVPQQEVSEFVSTIADVETPGEQVEVTQLDELDNLQSEEEASADITEMTSEILSENNSPALDSSKLMATLNLGEVAGGAADAGAQSLVGRVQAARGNATAKFGGSAGSEEAVEAGLNWLSRHQAEDGSWYFDHHQATNCDCKNPGAHKGTTGATGLALLCYFGAGYTFAEGEHSATISKGIQYLLSRMKINPSTQTGDLREADSGNGGIYQHAIATAALCEALSVNLALIEMKKKQGRKFKLIDSEGREITTGDLKKNSLTLRQACQLAVGYILSHQSEKTGGWGYKPKSSGDLSVTGWQVYAMLSSEHAKIPIPPVRWNAVNAYLNSVAHDQGTRYAYSAGQGPKDSMDAVGLFCRMLTGWKRNDPLFKTGVQLLSAKGPKANQMYYSYYATQVLFAYGDDEEEKLWTKWNASMRDGIIARQDKSGHATGSWPGTGQGGRFFETCLSVLTLEIYYRKLPMLQRLAVEPMKLD